MKEVKSSKSTKQKRTKTIADIELIDLDGQGMLAYITDDAAIYLGVTPAALARILKENKIEKTKRGFGSQRYVLKNDLDELLRPRPASEGDDGEEQNQIKDLIVEALYAEGSNHKQWYLWQIVEAIGIDLEDQWGDRDRPESGIVP